MFDPLSSDISFLATTMTGMEEVLGTELLGLGAREINPLKRAVAFKGDLGFLYKANFNLRTALRILIPIKMFQADTPEKIHEQVKSFPWEQLMDTRHTLAISATVNSPFFNHSLFIAQKVKDGITDRFRELTGSRPSVDLAEPDIRINIHITGDTCTLSLDSSGESLHKRGYRTATNIAPMNEVLAAGLIALTGWDQRSNFIDPMCGSGTLAIEAAMWAAKIPPGFFRMSGIEKQRDAFAFMRWPSFNKELWDKIYESSVAKISESEVRIYASDISPNVLKKTKENIVNARVDDIVRVKCRSFQELERPETGDRGVIVINPPYGERMDKDDLDKLYSELGDALKSNWSGYACWIITPNAEAVKKIGLHATRRITVFNGPLECKFLKYEMYAGTKKVHKLS